MASTKQYVLKVSFEAFLAEDEDEGKPSLEKKFVMRNLNSVELLTVDADLLKFYTEFMASLAAKAADQGLFLDVD